VCDVHLLILLDCGRRRTRNVRKWTGFRAVFCWLSARRSGNDWYVFCRKPSRI